MTRITHLAGGALVSTAYIGLADISHNKVLPFYFFAGLVGSVLPDIDLFLGRRTNTSVILKHRGITHTFLFVVLCLISTIFFSEYFRNRFDFNVSFGIIFVFILGILSHFALDLLNFEGLLFFWPISKKKFSLKLMKVGGALEYAMVLPVLVAAALAIGYYSRFNIITRVFHIISIGSRRYD